MWRGLVANRVITFIRRVMFHVCRVSCVVESGEGSWRRVIVVRRKPGFTIFVRERLLVMVSKINATRVAPQKMVDAIDHRIWHRKQCNM